MHRPTVWMPTRMRMSCELLKAVTASIMCLAMFTVIQGHNYAVRSPLP